MLLTLKISHVLVNSPTQLIQLLGWIWVGKRQFRFKQFRDFFVKEEKARCSTYNDPMVVHCSIKPFDHQPCLVYCSTIQLYLNDNVNQYKYKYIYKTHISCLVLRSPRTPFKNCYFVGITLLCILVFTLIMV